MTHLPWVKKGFWGISVGMLVFLLRSGYAQPPTFTGSPVEGRRIFVLKGCVRCHSVWGEGGKIGPDLARTTGRNFYEMAGLMWNHSPQMLTKMRETGTPVPTLSSDEMGHLLAYLSFLTYFDEPGDFARGEELFTQKGCILCHSVGGKGGNVGPSLDKFAGKMSPVYLAQAIWNHGPAMTEKMKEKGIYRPTYEKGEMADLLAFIRGSALSDVRERTFAPPGNADSGKALFTSKGCIRCHSIYGSGGTVGPDLGKIGLSRSVTEVAGLMWNHAVKMWGKMKELGIPIPRFEENEMADIFAYLYQVGYLGERGDASRGKMAFSQKKCKVCHSVNGVGGDVGPDLAKSPVTASPVSLASAMWNHAATMYELMRSRGIAWPIFRGSEISDIIAYIRTAKKTSPPLPSR